MAAGAGVGDGERAREARKETSEARRAALRDRMRAYRAALDPAERARRSARIAERARGLPAYRAARLLLVYLSLPEEADTGPLISLARRDGKRVAAPRALPKGRRLELRELVWPDGPDGGGRDGRAAAEPMTVIGTYGIREPDPDVSPPVEPGEVDLVCLPGLAFDNHGNRLGYGAGYYDRFLAAYPPGRRPATAGLAFAGQVVDLVPAGPWDVPVDWVVSEDEAIDCRLARRGGPAVPRSPRGPEG